MNKSVETILKKNYQNRLREERSAKGIFSTIGIPEGMETLKILPIQNLFYGNEKFPPRLNILMEQIKRINDMENGAFVFGGNLFYYPAGNTDKKEDLALRYINDLSILFKQADKNKILFMYNGVNETKFMDDRKLSRSIPTTKTLADNLGISNRFFDDTNVEIGFKFNNALTKNEDRFITAFFTSTAPISTTTNAIANKTTKASTSNIAKDLIVDTSSGRFYSKKRVLTLSNPKDPLLSQNSEQTLLSPAGYTDMPQVAKSKQTQLYPINNRYIELKIEPKNPNLHQDSIRTTNTIKDDPFDRNAVCLTFGVNYDSMIDLNLVQKLNDAMLENVIKQEQLEKQVITALHDNFRDIERATREGATKNETKIMSPLTYFEFE